MDPHRLPAEIHTPRLLVRMAREQDGPAIADAIEETLDLLVPWFKWAEFLDSWGDRGDFEGRALTAVRRFEEGEGPTYYLWAAGRWVGEVWLGAAASSFNVLDYNGWVRRGAVGSGYGAEGSRAVLAATFAAGFEASFGQVLMAPRGTPVSGCSPEGRSTASTFQNFPAHEIPTSCASFLQNSVNSRWICSSSTDETSFS